jgi:type IV fimbrial biogenesis protein FimT
MAIAVPGFQDFFRRNRVDAAASDLVTALNYARSEAIRRGARVTLCASANPSAATPTCADAQWAQGWVLFQDGGTKGAIDGTDTGNIMRVSGPAGSGVTISTGAHIKKFVSYLPSGRIDGVANDTYTICHGAVGKRVILNNTGRVRTEQTSC